MHSQAEEEVKDFQRIILVGDAGTGKTHLIYTFVREKAPTNIMPTVAVQYSSKAVQIDSLRKAKAQIWDTAGQETYRALTMNHYRKVHGAFVVFDVSRRSTYDHVAYWLQNLREKGEANLQIGLIGHKIDSSRREVSTQQAEAFAAKQHIFYCETTINDIGSVTNAFKKLLSNVLNAQNQEGNQNHELRLNQIQSGQGGCSC